MRPSGTHPRVRTHNTHVHTYTSLHPGELHKEIPDNPNYQHVNKWTLNPKVRTRARMHATARARAQTHTQAHTHTQPRVHARRTARARTHTHTHTLRRSR